MHFFGLFQIIQRIGNVVYKLQLPEETHIDLVFHVSLLKKCEGDPLSQGSILPFTLVSTKQGPFLQPLAVLKFRQLLCNGKLIS